MAHARNVRTLNRICKNFDNYNKGTRFKRHRLKISSNFKRGRKNNEFKKSFHLPFRCGRGIPTLEWLIRNKSIVMMSKRQSCKLIWPFCFLFKFRLCVVLNIFSICRTVSKTIGSLFPPKDKTKTKCSNFRNAMCVLKERRNFLVPLIFRHDYFFFHDDFVFNKGSFGFGFCFYDFSLEALVFLYKKFVLDFRFDLFLCSFVAVFFHSRALSRL